MRLRTLAVLAILMLLTLAVLWSIEWLGEQVPARPIAWTEGALIAAAAERVTASLGPADAATIRAPSPARTGAGLRFEAGRCVVTWYGDPRYGPWLYELSCEPEPEPEYGPVVWARVTGYYCAVIDGSKPVGDGGGYCGVMRWGKPVYVGAAACGGYWRPLAVLEIEGYGRVVCEDTGHLGWTQIDVYYPDNVAWATSQRPDWANVREVLR